jgi:hypothetical protein
MAQEHLEHAWRITESLHALLTASGPTDWTAVSALADELRELAATGAAERAATTGPFPPRSVRPAPSGR